MLNPLTLLVSNTTITECGADDVEMDSQLVDDGGAKESKQGCNVMEEEVCLQRGEGEGQQQPTTEQGEEEMSQDEGDNRDKDAVAPSDDQAGDEGRGGKGQAADEEEEMSQDGGDTQQTQQKDVVAPSDDQAGDEEREHRGGKVEAIGEEEQQPADEGEEVMSQDEEDKPQTQLTQQKDAVPADAHGDDQVGDEGGEGKAEETAGATGADKAAKVEEMASQGSGSDSDSDSEIPTFPNTLKEFGYYFKEGI